MNKLLQILPVATLLACSPQKTEPVVKVARGYRAALDTVLNGCDSMHNNRGLARVLAKEVQANHFKVTMDCFLNQPCKQTCECDVTTNMASCKYTTIADSPKDEGKINGSIQEARISAETDSDILRFSLKTRPGGSYPDVSDIIDHGTYQNGISYEPSRHATCTVYNEKVDYTMHDGDCGGAASRFRGHATRIINQQGNWRY